MDDWTEQEPIGARGSWYGPWQAPWQGRWQSRWRGPWQGPWWGRGPMWGRGYGFGPGRGPRGWYPEMGRRFPFGGGPGPRMFERGYLKYALLDLLQDQPKHGYEMMKDLEERTGGFYAPSAGAVYPTLQMLEDRGWTTSETIEGKKVYTITDTGRAALAEAKERRESRRGGPGFGPEFGPEFGPGFGPRGHGPHHEHHEHGPHGPHHHERPDGPPPPPPPGGPWGWGGRGRGGPGFGPGFDWRAQPEAHELARQARELGRMFLLAGRESINQPERIARLRDIVERTRAELEAFVEEARGADAGSGQAGAADSGAQEPTGPEGPVEQL